MTGLYLLSIKEYASAKTAAVTPEPQENTTFDEKSLFKTDLKIFTNSFLDLKVLSFFRSSLNGKHNELGIEPLLNPFLGSFSFPSNLSLLLASRTLNSCFKIFSSICIFNFTKSFLSVDLYKVGNNFVTSLVTVRFSDFHFSKPPSRTLTSFGSCPK